MKGNNVTGYKQTLPPKTVAEYRWTTNDGLHLRPSVVQTGHLFNSVVLMWHHTMGEDAKLYNHKRWNLGSRFTREYCDTSIRCMLSELIARGDLTKFQVSALKKMVKFLRAGTCSVILSGTQEVLGYER